MKAINIHNSGPDISPPGHCKEVTQGSVSLSQITFVALYLSWAYCLNPLSLVVDSCSLGLSPCSTNSCVCVCVCVCARSEFAGQLAFGEIRIPSTLSPVATSGARAASQQLLGPGFEKMKLPLLLTVCNGDLLLLEVYKGEMKGDPLRRHISGCSGSSSLAALQES